MEVRVDQWPALGKHDPEVSRELAEWADVIICEWCGPNAVWYSEWLKKHGRPDQRLVVRLHRFELYGAWPGAWTSTPSTRSSASARTTRT